MTVSVTTPGQIAEVQFNERDFKIEWYSGTGAGGQHRNKHQNSCRITHLATGTIVTAQHRSRENSLKEAKDEILARLFKNKSNAHHMEMAKDRKQQVGSGERGDKMRTYRFQDDTVKDHRSGKQASTVKVLAGYFNLLW